MMNERETWMAVQCGLSLTRLAAAEIRRWAVTGAVVDYLTEDCKVLRAEWEPAHYTQDWAAKWIKDKFSVREIAQLCGTARLWNSRPIRSLTYEG